MERNKTHARVLKMVIMGLLVAVSIVLVALIHIPFPPAPFLEYDPADIPIFVGTFLLGPVPGLALTVLASLVQGLTVSAGSGPIGIVMHILATGSFALVAGAIYNRSKTRKNAVVALGVGVLVQVAVMILCNLIFTPIFMGAPMKEVVAMLLPVILPFNLMKAGVNAVVTYIIYKPVSRVAHRILGQTEPAGG